MGKQTANVVLAQLADHAIAFGIKELVGIAFPQTLVDMHTGTVILKERFGHKGNRVTILYGDILGNVFVQHHFIRLPEQGVEAHAELHWPPVATS